LQSFYHSTSDTKPSAVEESSGGDDRVGERLGSVIAGAHVTTPHCCAPERRPPRSRLPHSPAAARPSR